MQCKFEIVFFSKEMNENEKRNNCINIKQTFMQKILAKSIYNKLQLHNDVCINNFNKKKTPNKTSTILDMKKKFTRGIINLIETIITNTTAN